MSTGFGLTLQQLGAVTDRVLVVGQFAGLRDGTKTFSPSDIDRIFAQLRVPRPGNTRQTLSRLRARQLCIPRGGGRWSVTPVGDERVRDLVGRIDTAFLEAELADVPGAEFAHVVHRVIPPSFAPPRWAAGISRLLERFPFETNVFCMTRFPDESVIHDPVSNVVAVVRDVTAAHGLTLHLASDRAIDDDLFGNVGAYTWACQYGIGLLENRAERGLNYNTVMELGAMMVTGRRCAMLKDGSVAGLPTDLAGQIYTSVDFDDKDAVAGAVTSWIRDDLGL